ncbi:ATP-binding protein [Methylobacterium sp. C1]|uniref:ATP-binding protein n=1 Tax=Methylobacterium sp. C1 TaxID=1479019 RepID=UPI0009F32CA3|nr:ATP-binding protein [Methylobacterium sp. C1]
MSRLREIQLETPVYHETCLGILKLLSETALARKNIALSRAAWDAYCRRFEAVEEARKAPWEAFSDKVMEDLTAPSLFCVGQPGAGKTYAIKMAIRSYPDLFPGYGERFSDCPIVTFNANSQGTHRSLGEHILEEAGLNPRTSLVNTKVWNMVIRNWEASGRYIIHIDDSYRIGRSASKSEFVGIRDKFAEIQDWKGCPFGLLISSTPEIAPLFETEGGMFRRLNATVHFKPMSDVELTTSIRPLIARYAAVYGLKIDLPEDAEFVFRHGHACNRAFGRSVEIIMDAVNLALTSQDRTIRVASFADALHRRYAWPALANPYLATQWWKIDVQKLLGNALEATTEVGVAADRQKGSRRS